MKSEIGVEAGKAMGTTKTPITTFIRHHFRHFNAAALIDAADAYRRHLEGGGKMMVTLAGAMSTAELGLSLAEMIRQGKLHEVFLPHRSPMIDVPLFTCVPRVA